MSWEDELNKIYPCSCEECGIEEIKTFIKSLLKKQRELCSKTIYEAETYLIPQEKIGLENAILNAPEPT